ncbi:MAG TPA: alpha/beta hydrolase domain-containing protein, partial [Myxococcales bacterium]|nr:alpha/beta hydrolase domain-containing protein [Myxococcales bacterium]
MSARSRASSPRRQLICALTIAAALVASPATQARITKVQITAHEKPTFGGHSFAGVGQYEKIAGKAFGEVNPNDPKNAMIVDIKLAPRNANGNVEYSFDFYILKPVDLSKGNHKVMYEPPNRGGKTWSTLARISGGGDDPGTITDAAVLDGSFLLPRGYSIVWSGWDFAAGTDSSNFNTTITLPIAKNPDGSSITGPSFEYIVTGGASYTLNYPAATLDQSQATLTHRVHLNDMPVVVPASGWKYDATGTKISLTSGSFVGNDIYEFSYTAKDPTVNGLGFAAVRDWNAWLRYETKDESVPVAGVNPLDVESVAAIRALAGDITKITTEISSQPGRFLNDFRHLGFNQAENGKKVFDALMQWIAAGDGINMNYRFSQTGRTERNRQDHLFIEGRFPFANVMSTDPITGQSDSRLASCTITGTCPVAAEIFSGNEMWVKAASLMMTDPAGRVDLPDSPYSRIYYMSSEHHGTGNNNGLSTGRGNCQQITNVLSSAPVQRAMFLALDAWIDGVPPPPSRRPRLSDGTLVPPLPQSGMGFPNIPGVTYVGLKTTRYLFNYGPNFYTTGIMTINPPVIDFTPGHGGYQDNPNNGPIYPSFIPKTDADGNDIAGLRLPDVTVPVATYTGWALRSG